MRTLAAFTLALLLPLAGCGDDASGPEDQDTIAGTYTLRTVNGNGLPFTLENTAAARVEVTGGHITLNENLSYSEMRGFRRTENGIATDVDEEYTGTYTYAGTDLFITTEDVIYPLTLGNGTITEQVRGFTIVWSR